MLSGTSKLAPPIYVAHLTSAPSSWNHNTVYSGAKSLSGTVFGTAITGTTMNLTHTMTLPGISLKSGTVIPTLFVRGTEDGDGSGVGVRVG